MAKSQTMGTTLTLIKAGAEPTNLVLEALKSILSVKLPVKKKKSM